jgi:hypothetical protein
LLSSFCSGVAPAAWLPAELGSRCPIGAGSPLAAPAAPVAKSAAIQASFGVRAGGMVDERARRGARRA